MCTSFVLNKKNTIVGFNLDILDMEYKVDANDDGVFIMINDAKEGWMPLFGVNKNGGFVGMPTCWPYDSRSDQKSFDEINIINLDIDYLLGKKTLNEIKEIVENNKIVSVPGLTFQSQISDKDGNVIQIVPGQGYVYKKKPKYMIMTNFSPFKGDKEKHPWMGLDRYNKAKEILENSKDDFNYLDGLNLLKEVSQQVCPTVVSLVYDAFDNCVYWCLNQNYSDINKCKMSKI